jgi:hypothetical protein
MCFFEETSAAKFVFLKYISYQKYFTVYILRIVPFFRLSIEGKQAACIFSFKSQK